MKIKFNNQSGFTLIEAFVAITILLLAVVGPISLVARSIADANYAANQITAFYLAQEGLELVINQREQNESLGREAWLNDLEDCTNDQKCQVSLAEDNNLIVEQCLNRCSVFYLDDLTDAYGYEPLGATPTHFTREVSIAPPTVIAINYGGGIEDMTISAKVESVIKWTNKGQAQSFTLSTLLTD